MKESGSNLQSSVLPYAFEVCQYQVVLAATIEPALKESGSLVGDSIPCKLEIFAKFWCDSASDNLEAVYEVKFSEASWLLSGLKRHRFSLNKDEKFVTTLDLIPVSAGKLLLPNVEVVTFTGGVQLYCGYPSSEEVMILPRESTTLFVPFGPAPV
ncbi:hypothetical protein BC830DRAFT_201308 [Chytriomyces sp. MP71]|nr:hypothetical protein BC830DRAFT_201308 [Chytriomyces sp. MP71]